jgi:hypothetical protein
VPFLVQDATPIVLDLVAKYPRSTRAGCAVLQLAQHSNGDARKRYLELAIANHGDAWCDNGVQVGALARALLAMSYADANRFDEAEAARARCCGCFLEQWIPRARLSITCSKESGCCGR